MSEVKLTPEQNEAIHSSGKNILVSASAGSGKTFVMAQRIVEKVKQGIEIDRLFISTFTKKAASELRMRLERDLKKARQESSDENQACRLTLALFLSLEKFFISSSNFSFEIFNPSSPDR